MFLLLLAAPAWAGRHVVQRGETLEHVARIHGCTTEAVLRANKLDTTLVPPGTVVKIPSCSTRSPAQTRPQSRPPTRQQGQPQARSTAARTADADLETKAQLALAVIDGTQVVTASRSREVERAEPADDLLDDGLLDGVPPGTSEAVGVPWNGRLVGGAKLTEGDGYKIRRKHRAYGASHVVEHLRRAIAGVRALYDVHTLAIGDLSARGGGKIGDHHSHQSGLDVDVGFYFHTVPEGYPDRFVAANADLDLEATWALLLAFVRTAHLDTGVQIIFLDHAVQRRLYEFAKKRGTPAEDLAMIFQYPRSKDTLAGLVRHWPNHADHFHVRFKPAR